MKKKYELTIILPSASSEKEAKGIVEEILKKSGGKITTSDFWGKKDLAYAIKKQTSGVYAYFELEASAEEMVEFEKRLRLAETILRYLLIVSDGKVNKLVKEEKKPVRAKKA